MSQFKDTLHIITFRRETNELLVNEGYNCERRIPLPVSTDLKSIEELVLNACEGDIDYVSSENLSSLAKEVYGTIRDTHDMLNGYLNPVEGRTDADVLLQLIRDDKIEAFRSGPNDSVYLIVPRIDGKGKQQISLSDIDEFSTYSRAIFARDYARIERMIILSDRIKSVKQMILESLDRDKTEKLNGDLKDFKNNLVNLAIAYRTSYGHRPTLHSEVAKDAPIKNVAEHMNTFANARKPLHLRAFTEGKTWLYDLQNPDYEYIEITSEGYKIRNDAYNYFLRKSKQGSNSRPEECNLDDGKAAFDKFFDGFNFIGLDGHEHSTEQKTLFKVFTIWLFYNDHRTMRPIESIKASPDSGKTTLVKGQKLIVDPAPFGSLVKTWGSGKTDDRRDRFVTASNHHFTVFDNVKKATNEEQDDLCNMATGGSSDTRALYTNADTHTLDIQTNIAYTSVNDIATWADLIRRQIPFKLGQAKIEINEDALFDDLIANRPKILHFVFTTLSKALALLETVDDNDYTKYRGFWKFVLIGDAIAEAMGEGALFVSKIFAEMPLQQARRAIENDAFGTAFVRFVITSNEMRLSLVPSEILTKVEEHAAASGKFTAMKDYTWPQSPKAVTSKLEYLKPSLAALGISLSRGTIHDGYVPWIIEKKTDDEGKNAVTAKKDGGKEDDSSNQNVDRSEATAIPSKPTIQIKCLYCDHRANDFDLMQRHSIKVHPGKPFASDYDRKL